MSRHFSKINPATGADLAVDYHHHELHEGNFFYVKSYADIANGADLDFLWVVPNTAKWPHSQWALGGEGELTVKMYEAVVTSNDGAAVTILNANRNSGTSAGVTVFTGPTVNSGALGDSGDGGDLVWSSIFGSGGRQQAVGAARETGYEFVGKQNTKYWFRINNSSGGVLYLDYDFNWYEHTNAA